MGTENRKRMKTYMFVQNKIMHATDVTDIKHNKYLLCFTLTQKYA